MRGPISIKSGAIALLISVVLVAVGVYAGALLFERQGIEKAMDESLTRTALNLQAIEYIRQGKATSAIDLIKSMNEANLVYLMRYDDMRSGDSEFIARKKKVLTALSKERGDHSKASETASYKSGPEWEQYQRDVDRYLKQNQ